MELVTFPYVIVRYQRENCLGVAVVFYAVSLLQASRVLQTLIEGEFDLMVLYAIRDAAECAAYPSFYCCGCGK